MSKTIGQLAEATNIDGNAMIPLDTGTQTFFIRAMNLVKSLTLLPAFPAVADADFSVTDANSDSIIRIDSQAGAFNISLPLATSFTRRRVTFKDIGGKLSSNKVGIIPAGGQTIEGLAQNYDLEADYGKWTFFSDGFEWFLI